MQGGRYHHRCAQALLGGGQPRAGGARARRRGLAAGPGADALRVLATPGQGLRACGGATWQSHTLGRRGSSGASRVARRLLAQVRHKGFPFLPVGKREPTAYAGGFTRRPKL